MTVIPKSILEVTGTNGEPVGSFTVFVDGRIAGGDSIEISDAQEADGVELRVASDGYRDNVIRVTDFDTSSIRVVLEKAPFHYEFTIPAYDDYGMRLPESIKATLDTTTEITTTPLRGYQSENRENYIYEGEGYSNNNILFYIYDSKTSKIRHFLWGVLSTLVVIGCVAAYMWLDSNYTFRAGWPPVKSQKERHTENHTATPVSDSFNQDSIRAVIYLDEHADWDETEMDSNPYIQGLYDDMVECDLQALTSTWGRKLRGSSLFSGVSAAASRAMREGLEPNAQKSAVLFMDRNTGRINVANYVNWLSKLGTQTTATPPATRPQHSQKIENVHERLRQPADSM